MGDSLTKILAIIVSFTISTITGRNILKGPPTIAIHLISGSNVPPLIWLFTSNKSPVQDILEEGEAVVRGRSFAGPKLVEPVSGFKIPLKVELPKITEVNNPIIFAFSFRKDSEPENGSVIEATFKT